MARSRRGSALIETMVGLVVVMSAMGGLWSVMAAAPRADASLRAQAAADRSIEALREALSLYVTADASEATASLAPGGSWRLPGDDACAWALDPACGPHDGSAYLDGGLTAEHPGARLAYALSRPGPDSPTTAAFTLTW